MQNLKINPQELIAWFFALCVTAIAFFLNYYFDFSGPIKAVIWIFWLMSIFTAGFFTSKGKQIFLLAKEAKIELQKVVWPTRQETIQTTSIVMVMVGLTGFILWMLDSLMIWAIAKITHLG